MTTPLPPTEAPATTLIEQAEAQLRILCGWHIAPQRTEELVADSTVETLIYDGHSHLAFLPTKNATAVTKVTANGKDIPLDRVELESAGVLEIKGLPRNTRRIHATVTHGYEQLPPALAAVATAMATRAANPHGAVRVGGISVGGTTAPSPQGAEWRTIDAYKLGPLP